MSSTTSFGGITRRSFLALPILAPMAAYASSNRPGEHYFQYDYVLGTSLDMVIWTSDAGTATAAEAAVLDEIRRLSSILNTRDPESEISRLGDSEKTGMSRELAAVLSAYTYWNRQTNGVISIRPRGLDTPRNVDALGKAFIIERATQAAFDAGRGIEGVLLNIGGDILARGRPCEISIANPDAAQDNAPPLTKIRLHNAAVATSGTYARGAHLVDPRTGAAKALASGATVVAPNAVIANALATALCLTEAGLGMNLVERVAGAEALRVSEGTVLRTSGFSRLETAAPIRIAAAGEWPMNYELNIALTLTNGAPPRGRGGPAGPGGRGPGGRGPGAGKRQYVAVWIENTSGKLVRVLAFWADKERYYAELSSFFTIAGGTRGGFGPRGGGGFGARGQSPLATMARATRAPGKYQLVWDGLDEEKKPVAAGTYRVVVETSQEHGTYAKQGGMIDCADKPAELALSATSNFEAVTIQYGPRPKTA